jgi:hypothetical protein
MTERTPEVGSQYPDLAAMLENWAGRYTPHQAVADRIIRKTVSVAATSPDLIDGEDMKSCFFQLLHFTAMEELMVPSPP